MSIFASKTQVTISIPFDLPNTVTLRALTGKESDEAQESHRGSLASGSARSWANVFRRSLEKGPKDDAVLKALADPVLGFDRFVVISKGLVAWSYTDAPLNDPVARQAAIDDLKDGVADFFATEILRLTRPALFETPEERDTIPNG